MILKPVGVRDERSITMSNAVNNSGFYFEPGEELFQQTKLIGGGDPLGGPPRKEGEGPYKRLILKNVIVIDGEGNPPHGPHDIIIEGDVIKEVRNFLSGRPPEPGDREIDCNGKFVMPGFVNAHVHIGCSMQATVKGPYAPSEYVYKLWLAHGITTVRDCGSLFGFDWTEGEARKSEANEITAPRIHAYPVLGFPWYNTDITDAKAAKAWVEHVADKGAKGIKLFGQYPAVMEATIKEARARGLRVCCHHSVNMATAWNVLDSVKAGLTSSEHFLGFAEALNETSSTQNYPFDYHYDNELMRVRQDSNMWKVINPGSPKWKDVIETMIEHDFSICPTLVPWETARDVERFRNSEWHKDYTHPTLMRFFYPNPANHWAYYWDWTTQDEIDMRNAYQKWMQFLFDYKNAGGRVVTGDDTGFGYSLYGFGFIRELELFQEAGWHPLEVLSAATIKGAELLGVDKEIGSILPGKKADLQVVDENPLMNWKVLYGTGHKRLNFATGQVDNVRALRYTIKDGIVYDPAQLLEDCKEIVAKQKAIEAKEAAV